MTTFHRSHAPLTREAAQTYESLNKTQWLSTAALRELQDEKLRRLIRHAYRHVPYYRQRMQLNNLRPEDIRGQEDLAKLPLLSKEDVRRNLYFDITADNLPRAEIHRISSSGCTGEPFVCFADRRQLEFRWASALRAREWAGYRLGDASVRLWNQALGSSTSERRREQREAFMVNRKLIGAFELTDANLDQTIQSITEAEPALLEGYTEVLDFLAQYIAGSVGNLAHRPKALLTSSQTLTERTRHAIEAAFGAPVFDCYTSRELGGIAYECDAHRGYHVVAEGYIVEILVDGRPANPGETGELVITDLNNYAMPFIRYQIGDLATAGEATPCVCGRGAPRIAAIQGRMPSIIHGTDGHYVPGTFFAHVLKDYEYAIRHFQVVQHEPGMIELCVVKAGRYSSEVMETVQTTIRQHLGEKLRIDVRFVDHIEAVRKHKHVASQSLIPVDFRNKKPRAAS
jgi:phenylacetate-CoA ligase